MGNAAVAMFILYHVFFGCTWGGVPWVYSAEVNSLGWRTRGAAAATATNWIMGFVVVQFTKVGIDNLGWAFYLSKLAAPLDILPRSNIPCDADLCDSICGYLLLLLPCRVLFLS
jgi:hypothetical protein